MWQFETDCIHSDCESITDMVDQAKEISYRTMLKAVGRPFIERQYELGYDIDNMRGGLRLSKDWAVSYYRSFYQGRPCYYFVWSHIEQIFTEV